jgi:serine/threonine protein kinase
LIATTYINDTPNILTCINILHICCFSFYSANILLDEHFVAKISDLGMAKPATGGETAGRLTHITKKTTSISDYKNKAYHPPEIARGNGFSIKGDAYSFGVVSYFSLICFYFNTRWLKALSSFSILPP